VARPTLQIVPDADALARAAAKDFLATSLQAVRERDVFSVALSGGSTPKRLYELLANPAESFFNSVPWEKTHFFWTDERHVPPDSPESNYRMVNEAMLSHVPTPPSNVYRVLSERSNAQDAAAEYEKTLRQFFTNAPRFDLELLGIGIEGHTASIFPGSEIARENSLWVASPWIEKLKSFRITLTLPVLNDARSILFLVSGVEKAQILRTILETKPDGNEPLPAQAIKPVNGKLKWLVDKAAAGGLNSN